jgi:hypothetical protein
MQNNLLLVMAKDIDESQFLQMAAQGGHCEQKLVNFTITNC